MAQGKMTSRQRMINMMYLVLLALLALSVSTEVLDSFVSIRARLRVAAAEADSHTAEFANYMDKEIEKEVENRGDRTNVGLKDTLRQIRRETREMIGQLDRHIGAMETIANWDETDKRYQRPDELELNYRYWMGQNELDNQRRGNGAAYQLRDSLDTFSTYLTEMYNSQVKADSLKMTTKALEDPDPAGRDDKAKRWEEYTFEGPVVANLASLEALKIDVYGQEKELMDLLNTRLGVVPFAPDKVEIISAPLATIVPAGMSFRTKLFVGLSSSEVHPQFSSNQGQISVEEDGNSAWLSIPADGRSIPAGQREGKQVFTATVQVPRASGGYETITLQEEFRVLRPEVLIRSASIQSLYRECGNSINIDVPALGDNYNPVVSATQAEVHPSSQSRKKFRIVPTGNKCKLSVSNRAGGQTTKIQDIDYRVIAPPKPVLRLMVNGRDFNGYGTINKNSRIQVGVVPDREFLMTLPEDARYEIGQVEVLLQQGLEPPKVVNVVNMQGRNAAQPQRVNLGSEVRQARPGSRVFVRIKNIYRKNYKGTRVPDDRFPEMERTISLQLR